MSILTRRRLRRRWKVHFRKRLSLSMVGRVNERMVERAMNQETSSNKPMPIKTDTVIILRPFMLTKSIALGLIASGAISTTFD